MIDVWQEFIKDDLPVDTIWSDIDYMTDFTDFTIDTTRYSIPDMNKMRNLSQYQIFFNKLYNS